VPLTRGFPPLLREGGGNADARYKPVHGVRWQGLLRGLLNLETAVERARQCRAGAGGRVARSPVR